MGRTRRSHIHIDQVEYKWCSGCQNYIQLLGFRRSVSSWDGLHDQCRLCVKKSKKARSDKSAGRRRFKKAKQIRRAKQQGCTVYYITFKDMVNLFNQPCRYKSSRCAGIQTIEHIVPLSRGGTHGIGNLTILCSYHNTLKNNMLHTEFVKVYGF